MGCYVCNGKARLSDARAMDGSARTGEAKAK
uniref:Uncharacterized protein n=2 Tax=unclassified Caudoviricetes TaxID=2788787 RepID=A0A8S5VCF6_9CAUD|nr:MAG TPA: hypothetical protein [Siphoviridae sp. ctHDv29]DAG04311.1 MAG TPA: hypothetical protein [Siphoviridae sp. ctKsH2]DAR61953.1 MAG TPA: hypothetical protein [Caudoviricetes sp.]